MGAAGGTPRIVALGGHEFRSRPAERAIVRHLLELTRVQNPRVCLLPTASGDPQASIADFYSVLDRFDCRPTHVALFRMEREWVNLRDHLLEQDLIYAAGGSMLNLIAIWRAHGLAEIMREAWETGILLAGQSAGAMCWFEHGITSSAGEPRAAEGLGLLPGTLCVHYARDPKRRTRLMREVQDGLPGGYGIDDGAGLLFEGTRPVEAFAGRDGSRVVRVEGGEAQAKEMVLRSIPLRPELTPVDDPAIAEMRELRRSRVGMRAGRRR
ncbi:MAG: peptidase E [Actinomycetota bacterium]|nr:peptidase E [Actinomycetota bacterium]